jgi:hypothetical protein
MLLAVGIELVIVRQHAVSPVRSPKKKKNWIDPRANEVHCPVAHARPLDPQLFPFGAKISVGQADEFPVHISGESQVRSLAGRQTCVAGAN